MEFRDLLKEEFRSCVADGLAGKFWTHIDELVEDIKDLGIELDRTFIVGEVNDEYISFEDEDSEFECFVYLGHAGNTIWIQKVEM